jgi:hypothetical protein
MANRTTKHGFAKEAADKVCKDWLRKYFNYCNLLYFSVDYDTLTS